MSRKHLKRYLMLLSAVGLLAIGTAGSGTFASFNAEVASPNNYFATGTLFLHATKQGGTACRSEIDSNNANILSSNGCDVLFNLSNVNAGQTATVNLQLDNAGSLDATALKFALGSAGCVAGKSTITTITPAGISAGAQTTINVGALPYALFAGTVLNITDGTNSDTVTLAAGASASATSINVTGSSTTFAYAAGSKVQWNQQFGSANLCSGLLFTIQEKNAAWASNQKCIYPTGGSTNCSFAGAPTVSAITTTLNDLTADLWTGGPNGASALQGGKSRFITINVQAPSSFTNTQQNRSALFDLLWHIES